MRAKRLYGGPRVCTDRTENVCIGPYGGAPPGTEVIYLAETNHTPQSPGPGRRRRKRAAGAEIALNILKVLGTLLLIGITTGGANGMSTEERFSVIEEFQPEMASANSGSMNFCYHKLAKGIDQPLHDWELPYITRTYDNVFKNTFKDMEYCIRTMNRCGTLPEYEVFDYGQLSNLAYFKKEGIITQPIYIQFVPGVMGGFPMSGESMLFMIDQAKKILGGDVQYSTVAGGRRMFRFATMMAIQGGNVRVGMEDGLYIKSNGELATSNAQQVEKIRRILESLDYEIATPQEAREMLHLKGKDQVNF